MPAEWEPHAGCYLIWPERPDNWRLGAKPAQAAFSAVAEAIASTEDVTVVVSAAQYANARERLPAHVRVVEMSTNDAWVRDSGPSFVTDDQGGLRAVSWQFNAWGGLRGGLYFPWDADNLVGPKIAGLERVALYEPDLVLEGGAIDTDGEGTLLTTEECVLNPNRNPSLRSCCFTNQGRCTSRPMRLPASTTSRGCSRASRGSGWRAPTSMPTSATPSWCCRCSTTRTTRAPSRRIRVCFRTGE
jgi:agmatine/peptidylarginine deiminase